MGFLNEILSLTHAFFLFSGWSFKYLDLNQSDHRKTVIVSTQKLNILFRNQQLTHYYIHVSILEWPSLEQMGIVHACFPQSSCLQIRPHQFDSKDPDNPIAWGYKILCGAIWWFERPKSYSLPQFLTEAWPQIRYPANTLFPVLIYNIHTCMGWHSAPVWRVYPALASIS